MEELIKSIRKALQLPNAKITNIIPAGGMTNLNYIVTIDSDQYVVRIAGNGTEALINREEEKGSLEHASKLGINPELCYFNEKTGLKITRKVENSETMTAETAKQEGTMEKVVTIFRTLHFSTEQMSNRFKLFDLIARYEHLALKADASFDEGFKEMKKSVHSLKRRYAQLNTKEVPCHIDPAPSNFIFNEEGKLYLIDWEYSGVFDPIWDIAAYSLEAGLSNEEETYFLKVYLQKEPSELERERMLLHKIFQDFLWTLWTLYKEEKGDNFGTYGKDRFERAKRNIEIYKSTF